MSTEFDPPTLDAYNVKWMESYGITGFGWTGPDAVALHFACPFCASPGFADYFLLDMEPVMVQDHACLSCGRSARAIFSHADGGTSFELVQTGGDDPPAYLPAMRRM